MSTDTVKPSLTNFTVILAHASCFTPSHYRSLVNHLVRPTTTFTCPQLPTSSPTSLSLGFPFHYDAPPPPTGYPATADDATTLRLAIEEAVETRGHDALVVAHGEAGVAATEAVSGLKALWKRERATRGERGGVLGVLYAGAFLLNKGESVWGKLCPDAPNDIDKGGAGGLPEWMQLRDRGDEGLWTIANPEKFCFYYPTPPRAMRWLCDHLTASPVPALRTRLAGAEVYASLPTRYLVLGGSRLLSEEAQERMLEDVNEGLEVTKANRRVERKWTGLGHAVGVVEAGVFANEILEYARLCRREEEKELGWDFVEDKDTTEEDVLVELEESDVDFFE